jgi:hypothetical protein
LKSWSRSQKCAREGKRRKEDERLNRSDHKKKRRKEGSAISVNSKRNQPTGRGNLTPKEKKKRSSKKVSKLQVQS